jgi:hypothetical protein
MVFVDGVMWMNVQLPLHSTNERQIYVDPNAPVIKKNMVVGAHAQDVVRGIGSLVGGSERPDVGGLRIRPR